MSALEPQPPEPPLSEHLDPPTLPVARVERQWSRIEAAGLPNGSPRRLGVPRVALLLAGGALVGALGLSLAPAFHGLGERPLPAMPLGAAVEAAEAQIAAVLQGQQ